MQNRLKSIKKQLKLIFAISLAIPLVNPVETSYAARVLFCETNYALYGCTVNECTNDPSSSARPASSVIGDGGGCGNNAGEDQANKDQVWGYFVNKFTQEGYTKDEAEKATAGIMGNWLQESGFNPYRHEAPNPGSGCNGASGPITGTVGLGIAQWCGSRQQDLADYAAERGTDITCLGTQLEFTWKEMQERNLHVDMKGLSPAESSQIFDEIFEVSNGTGERQKKGEDLYKEYTGKDPGTLTASAQDTGNGCTTPGVIGSGAIPGETCAEAQPAVQEAIADDRVILGGNAETEHEDLSICSDTPLENCTEGTRGITQRGLMAGVNSTGTNSVTLTSIHQDHGCDSGDHPNGLALDIGAVNGELCHTDSTACDALFKYYIENAEELGIRWIIYNGSGCQEAVSGNENISECRGDHSDHIHVSFRE